MTKHSIDELLRQLDAAKSKAKAANDALDQAKQRVREARGAELIAKFEAMGGIVGVTKVRESIGRGVASRHRGPFVVRGYESSRYDPDTVYYDLAKLKKDGTMSAAGTGTWSVTEVVILPEDNA